MRRLAAISVAAGALATACCAPSAPAAAAAGAREDAPAVSSRVPREYLVTLAPGADAAAIADVYGRFGIARVRDVGRNVFLVVVAEDPGPERMEELRGRDARIVAVQPNYAYRR
jgi:hypothetical protein